MHQNHRQSVTVTAWLTSQEKETSLHRNLYKQAIIMHLRDHLSSWKKFCCFQMRMTANALIACSFFQRSQSRSHSFVCHFDAFHRHINAIIRKSESFGIVKCHNSHHSPHASSIFDQHFFLFCLMRCFWFYFF